MRNDPVNAAMLEMRARFGPPAKQHAVDGKRVDWTPEQYDQLSKLAGRGAYSGMMELMSDPGWSNMDNDARLKAAGKVFDAARKDAREAVQDGAPVVADGRDPWAGFPDEGEDDPWSAFPDAEQRNVVGGLETAIPGIRFTSRFHTPEYQADMRRRGYKPATNSAHLDGAALDMLPPPGRSLGWLRQQVEHVEPSARLLVHDGHLHATFPDWQGAPVLRSARGFGLNNPAGLRGKAVS